MRLRQGHFMPAALLDSQLATLEVPTGEPGVFTVDGAAPLDDIVSAAVLWLRPSEESSRD